MNAQPDQSPTTTPEESDAALVDLARLKVRGALERLIRRHNQRLYRVARAQLGSDQEAEEATQQAWTQAIASLGQWQARGPLTGWLVTVVLNVCRQRRSADGVADADEALEAPHPGPLPDEQVQRAQVRVVLERTVDALPAGLRVVFVMREVEGLSTLEVAGALGLTEEAVRVRLHRARQALQRSLDTQFEGEGRGLYPFLGARCDRITAAVLQAVGAVDG